MTRTKTAGDEDLRRPHGRRLPANEKHRAACAADECHGAGSQPTAARQPKARAPASAAAKAKKQRRRSTRRQASTRSTKKKHGGKAKRKQGSAKQGGKRPWLSQRKRSIVLLVFPALLVCLFVLPAGAQGRRRAPEGARIKASRRTLDDSGGRHPDVPQIESHPRRPDETGLLLLQHVEERGRRTPGRLHRQPARGSRLPDGAVHFNKCPIDSQVGVANPAVALQEMPGRRLREGGRSTTWSRNRTRRACRRSRRRSSNCRSTP